MENMVSFTDLFTPQNLVYLKTTNKETAIHELINTINRSHKICTDEKELVKKFMKREQQGSTGLQNGIAVPHIKIDTLKKFYLAVGIHQEGIDFQSLDKQPTHVIFLLISPFSESSIHLKFLSIITRVFLKKNFYNEVLAQKDEKKICDLLKELFKN